MTPNERAALVKRLREEGIGSELDDAAAALIEADGKRLALAEEENARLLAAHNRNWDRLALAEKTMDALPHGLGCHYEVIDGFVVRKDVCTCWKAEYEAAKEEAV